MKRVLIILVLCIISLLAILLASYKIEKKSIKLPAVVRSNKVAVSSDVDGVVSSFSIDQMDYIKKNERLAVLENSNLLEKQLRLAKQKSVLQSYINDLEKGDQQQLKLLELERDIKNTNVDIHKFDAELELIRTKLAKRNTSLDLQQKVFETQKELFKSGKLSVEEFDDAFEEYQDLKLSLNEVTADSIKVYEDLETEKDALKILLKEKEIYSNNKALTSPKDLDNLIELESELVEVETAINHLEILSPIDGIVTELKYIPGEKVEKGDIVAEITDTSLIWIIAYGGSSIKNKIMPGQKVDVYTGDNQILPAKVESVSPIMERVKSLSSSYETSNTYIKINIKFNDLTSAMQHFISGERLFVRIHF